MSRLLTICFLLFLTFPGGGSVFAADDVHAPKSAETQVSQPESAQEGPVIQVSEPTFDFGEAMENDEISHDFIVKNTGKAVLQIDKVSPG